MFEKNLTSKSSKNKIFCGFLVFKNVLWQKNENPEMPGINRKLSKSKKAPSVNLLPLLEIC